MKIEIEKTVLLKLSPKDFDTLFNILAYARHQDGLSVQKNEFIKRFFKETGEVI